MSTRHHAGRHIGIIGAGIAGLHLGLRLQRLGIACTIITDRTPEQVAAAQLTNIVVHWPTTLRRERALGVYHWPAEEFGFNVFQNRSEHRSRSTYTSMPRNRHVPWIIGSICRY